MSTHPACKTTRNVLSHYLVLVGSTSLDAKACLNRNKAGMIEKTEMIDQRT